MNRICRLTTLTLALASVPLHAEEPISEYACISRPEAAAEPDQPKEFGFMLVTLLEPQQDDRYSRIKVTYDEKVSVVPGEEQLFTGETLQELVIDSRHLRRDEDDRYLFSASGRLVRFAPDALKAAEGPSVASVSELEIDDPAFNYECEEVSPEEDPIDVFRRQLSEGQN